jgi:hypothetical protein
MNKQEAKRLAEENYLTEEMVKQTLLNAQNGIKDWTVASALNKGLSLGYAYNLYSKIDVANSKGTIIKYNFLVIFGDYLPAIYYENPIKEAKKQNIYVHHEEPNFLK